MSRFSNADSGYALVVVLIALAVFLLFACLTAGRVVREVRIAKTDEYTEMALYAADSGFNRARARILMLSQNKSTEDKIIETHPNGLNERQETLTFKAPGSGETQTGGTYKLTVQKTSTVTSTTKAGTLTVVTYRVVSIGTYGSGIYEVRRVVAGDVKYNRLTDSTGKVLQTSVTATYLP